MRAIELEDRDGHRPSPAPRILEDEGALSLVVAGTPPGNDETLPLPVEALLAVFVRYGRPLAVEGLLPAPERVEAVDESGARVTLSAIAYRAPVDVIANDWLVLERGDDEPVAAPSRLAIAALVAVARAFART